MNNTTTLESQPLNASVAISTPYSLDYYAIAEKNAKRKSSNGQTITNNKGKVSLLTACIDEVRSLLSLPEYDEEGSKTRIGQAHVESLKQAINSLFDGRIQQMQNEARQTGAMERVRLNFLNARFNEEKGTFDVSLNSSYTSKKQQAMNSANYKFGLTMRVEQAKRREKSLLNGKEQSPKLEQALAKLRREILKGETELAKINSATVK